VSDAEGVLLGGPNWSGLHGLGLASGLEIVNPPAAVQIEVLDASRFHLGCRDAPDAVITATEAEARLTGLEQRAARRDTPRRAR